MNKFVFAAAALALSTVSGSAGADTLPTRAASALGMVIATQGNAALIQIRREMKDSALRTIEAFLPKPSQKVADEPAKIDPPAETRSVQLVLL
jgi:hypothetical protein